MMLMPPFTLHHPGSIEQAVSIASDLMSKGEEFDWVAAGLMSCQTTNGVSILNLMLSH